MKTYLDSEDRVKLRSWHEKLNDNRGDRARLRRAKAPEDILLTDAFFNFLNTMPDKWAKAGMLFKSAALAGLLAHVKSDLRKPSRISDKDKKQSKPNASFAEQLGTPLKGQKVPLSELRFQQLQKSRSTDDFYRRMIRAIRLLDGNVNLVSLADDIIQWHMEFNKWIDRQPTNRLAVRWATDYYTALLKN